MRRTLSNRTVAVLYVLFSVAGAIVLHATSSHLAEAASALVEHGMSAQTPVAVTSNGTINTQRTLDSTLASLATDAGELVGPLVVTIGEPVSNRQKLSWWESRALYGWKVLVPRTKEQAGDMAERILSHGATPHEVPTISVTRYVRFVMPAPRSRARAAARSVCVLLPGC